MGVKSLGCALLVLLLGGCATARPPSTPSSDASRQEIRVALQRWNDATSRGDLDAFMAQLDDGAEVLVVGSDKGEVFSGTKAIAGWLGKMFVHNRFAWDVDGALVGVDGDSAWVFVDGAMTVRDPAGKLRGKVPYRFSGVLARRGGVWRWRLFHGSVPGKE